MAPRAGVSAAGVGSGAIVNNNGVEYIASGGLAVAAMVNSGGHENLAAGGIASGALIGSGGLLIDAGVVVASTLNGAGGYIAFELDIDDRCWERHPVGIERRHQREHCPARQLHRVAVHFGQRWLGGTRVGDPPVIAQTDLIANPHTT